VEGEGGGETERARICGDGRRVVVVVLLLLLLLGVAVRWLRVLSNRSCGERRERRREEEETEREDEEEEA
jgi:Na+-transporting methylmalonyl-CoA/oxaloacetate decarboxylase gamma subunit